MTNQIILPRIMQIGSNASKEIINVLKSLNAKNSIIITDKTMVSLGYVKTLTDLIKTSNISVDVFDDTIPEPTVESIRNGVDIVSKGKYDSIIALGGGSPIDSAKAIGLLAKYGGEIKDYKFPRLVTEPGIPIIAIPTTAGTGSEVTKFTIISDESNNEKMLCVGVGFMPVAALIDYELTMSLPKRTTADTGIDALTHAIEAYVSKKANLYSDHQSLAAMKLIAPNLRNVYKNGDNREAREAMMLGSTFAGIAFSNASVALVHGMSRPIGASYHVPHGLSNAMLLPVVTEYSIPYASKRYADCSRAMGVAFQEDSDSLANDKLINELMSINIDLDVPNPKEFGIDKNDYMNNLEKMAQQAIASGSPGNNPRVPSSKDIIKLYKSLW